MKLGRVHGTQDMCRWLGQHGLTPSENAFVGFVHDVHTDGSWHYKWRLGVLRADRQGTCAIDLNDNDVRDTKFYRLRRGDWKLWRPSSETEALNFAYTHILRAAKKNSWPLAEAFFAGRGFKDDTGYGVNRPIGGHDTHGHFGFRRDRW